MNMTSQQKAAVDSDASSILLVAGAGTGKTTVFIQRIRHLIHEGARPESIAAVTFTNSAAKEIEARLNVGDPVRLGYIGTLHSFMLRLLQKHGATIGLSHRLTVLDAVESEAMLEQCVTRLKFKGTRKLLDAAVANGVNWARRAGHETMTPVERVAYEYFYQLLTTGSLTYDMILELGLELLSDPQVQKSMLAYERLLVDESHDCADIDFQILDAMPFKTRFYVFDYDQKIYSWRNNSGDSKYLYDLSLRATQG